METDHNYYYIFNNSEEIHKICSNFDFSLYMDSLNSNEIDCFDDKNLLYYSRENIKSFFSEGLTLPYSVYSMQYAFIVCSIIPVIVIYPSLQKYFAAGVNVGGVKE